MKTERRHDLETNELAKYTAAGLEKAKPFGSQIFGAALAVFGLVILFYLWSSSQGSKEAAAWTDYALALGSGDNDLLDLQQVALDESHEGTKMQEWAFVTWADRQTAIATVEYLSNRESAQERLDNVSGIYEELVKGAADEQIVNRAHYGLGRVYEMQNRLEEAREQYDKVRGDYEVIARDRSDNLLKPEIQEACQWLASAELPKRTPTGVVGDRPLFEADVPESSGFDARSLNDILGFSGDEDSGGRYDNEKSESADVEGADDTQEKPAELDEIFLEDEPAEQGEPQTETDAEAETAEP